MKPSIKNLVTILILMMLVACTTVTPPTNIATPTKQLTPISSTASAIPASISTVTMTASQNSISPTLLAEWTVGQVNDMAWSPDGKMFAVNYSVQGNELNTIQVFGVESLNSLWITEDSRAFDLIFTSDGKSILESSFVEPILFLRSVQHGNIVRQIESDNCDGSQFIIYDPSDNTVLAEDILALGGLNYSPHKVYIYRWNLNTGICNELIQNGSSFNVFDLNSKGMLLAYNGEGEDNPVIIWDLQKQKEICRAPNAVFGHFVPNENILAIIKDRKIVFIDASSCQELRELNLDQTDLHYFSFSSNGKWLAIFAGQSIEIIETATGKTIAQISLTITPSPFGYASKIVFSPDSNYLLLGFSMAPNSIDSGKVQLWQLQK
jgi:WD40 repeat protein